MGADTEKWLNEEITVAAESQRGFGQSTWGTLVGIATALWLASQELTNPVQYQAVAAFLLIILVAYDALEGVIQLVFQQPFVRVYSKNRYQSVLSSPLVKLEALAFFSVRYGIAMYLAAGSPLVSITLKWYLATVLVFLFVAALILLVSAGFKTVRKESKPSVGMASLGIVFALIASYSSLLKIAPIAISPHLDLPELKLAALIFSILWLITCGLKQRRAQIVLEELIDLRRAMRSGHLTEEAVISRLDSIYIGVTREAYYQEIRQKQLETVKLRFAKAKFWKALLSLTPKISQSRKWRLIDLAVRGVSWFGYQLSLKRLWLLVKCFFWTEIQLQQLEQSDPELASRNTDRRMELEKVWSEGMKALNSDSTGLPKVLFNKKVDLKHSQSETRNSEPCLEVPGLITRQASTEKEPSASALPV